MRPPTNTSTEVLEHWHNPQLSPLQIRPLKIRPHKRMYDIKTILTMNRHAKIQINWEYQE